MAEHDGITFQNSQELLEYLREHCDDIDSVVIPVQEAIQITGARHEPQVWKGIGALLKLCNGNSAGISRDDAAMLINDGVLQRLKIKCILDPLNKP